MKKDNIFSYLDYREFLSRKLKNQAERGYKASLAEAAGCQRSYLSQVLSNKADFLPEHAIEIARFWNLSESESEYFLFLVLYSRASTSRSRQHFREKLERARKEQENLVKRITEKTVIPEETAAIFYSNWQFLATTILLSIPRFRTVPSIARRLNVSDDVIQKTLNVLEKLGLVVKSGDVWIATNATIHLPRDSKFNSLNHSHWRNKAVENSFVDDHESVHYTSVCTLTLADAQKIKELVLQLIDESRKIVAPSKEEEMYCLTCDWFKV